MRRVPITRSLSSSGEKRGGAIQWTLIEPLESTEAVEKRVSYDVGDTRPGPSRLPLIDWRLRLERGDQVLIAAVSGPTPMIAITRFRL
jgi:hypothetical protein